MSAPFSLVAWNIFQGLHHSSKHRRWVQNRAIEKHLAGLDADVLILPEMWRFSRPHATWAEDFATEYGYELHQWMADRPSRPQENVRWRIVAMTRIPATGRESIVFPESGRYAARSMVQLELTESGLSVGGAHLYGIHLLRHSPRAWLEERHAFRMAASKLDIVAGDMNMWGPIVRRDALDKRSAASGRTYPANRPHSQIDHILVNDRVEVLQTERLPDLGSDHLGLKVVLQAR